MTDKVRAESHVDRMSPDVRALLKSADDKSKADRTARRFAARARAEAARQKKHDRRFYDRAIFAALAIFISVCWVAAGFALYFL